MKNLIDEKFGRLTVKSFIGKDKFKKNLWECECECGQKRIIMQSNLKNQISCGCYKKEYLSEKYWQGYKEISGDYWSTIRRNAVLRNIVFDIQIEDVWRQYCKQSGLCQLTRLVTNFARNKQCNQTASIDRIDSSKGYTVDNIQILHKIVNECKQDFEQDYFIKLCISTYLKKELNDCISNNRCLSQTFIYRVKNGAKRRGIKYNLKDKDLLLLLEKQNYKCQFTNSNLYFNSTSRTKDGNISLDRIDSNLDYEIDNVRFIHKDINLCKWNYTDKIFLEMCRLIYEKNGTGFGVLRPNL